MAYKVKLHINKELCKGCGLCCCFCPKNILSLGDTVNTHGYCFITVIEQDKCIGCANCYQVCPDLVFTISKGFTKESCG